MTLFVALVALTGWAQVNPSSVLTGAWTGKLKVGAISLTLVLHLDHIKRIIYLLKSIQVEAMHHQIIVTI